MNVNTTTCATTIRLSSVRSRPPRGPHESLWARGGLGTFDSGRFTRQRCHKVRSAPPTAVLAP